MGATLEGVNVSVTFKITGFFEDSSILVPTNVNVTIGDGPELVYEIQARILSDTDGDGDLEPVQGPNGLFTGTVTLDISGNEVHASYSGQAQPGDFTISIAHLTPAGDPFAPGTFINQGGFSGVNTLYAPTYDPSTATLTLHWGFLGFQPGTSVNQTVFYDNELADAPVAGDDAYHVFVGSSLSGANVLDNDTDLDNANSIGVVDPSSVLSVNGASGNVGQWIDLAAGGRIRLNSDGSLSFDDDGDFSDLGSGETRDVTFNYTVTDTANLTDDAQVTITVEGVNSAPVAGDDSAATAEDTPVTIAVLGNDSDVDSGQVLTITAVTNGAHGNAVLTGGAILFTPNANFNGSDTITYTVSDGHGGTDTATVTITVNPVNDAPVAGDDTATTDEDTPLTLTAAALFANDSDVDNDTLSLAAVTNGAHGSAVLTGGAILFTPNANFNGSDTITYTVSDGHGGTDTATVTITVNPVNDAPVAGDDTATTDEDTPLTLSAAALFANDSDVDNDTLSVTAVTNGAHGSAVLTGGAILFTPNANFNGSDTITYTVSDGHGGTDTATVTITVNPVNDAPVAGDDTATTDEDTPLTLSAAALFANDSDVDNDTLSLAAVTNGAHGSAVLTGGAILYTPNANFNGSDTITYTVSDGHGGTDTATVTITVNPVNDAPVITSDGGGDSAAKSVPEHSTLVTTLAASDVDTGDALTFSITDAPPGVFELRNGNEVHFVTAPDLGDSLLALRYALTVQVSDGNGGIDTQSIFVNVTDVKEAITNGDAGGTLSGTAGDDLIDGQGGNDTINAGGGYDTIIGGPGGDVVNAGEGDDTIVATIGDGSDIYNGGPGLDTLDMSGVTAPVTINLAQSTASSSQTGQDSLNSIENAIGGSGNDLITGNGVDNRLDGGAGNDTINAGSGDDTVIGGAGNDTMNGQGGNDVFVFAAGFGNDQILQFDADPAGGQDRLDLTAFGITNADFAARVTVADVGGDTLITIDGNAAQTILLLGISNRAVSEEDCLLL